MSLGRGRGCRAEICFVKVTTATLSMSPRSRKVAAMAEVEILAIAVGLFFSSSSSSIFLAGDCKTIKATPDCRFCLAHNGVDGDADADADVVVVGGPHAAASSGSSRWQTQQQ